MLLTKIDSGAEQSAPAARPRFRRHAGVKLSTMDRRTFLKRSGLVAGAGAFASQLPYGVIGKAAAQGEAGPEEGKRTRPPHRSGRGPDGGGRQKGLGGVGGAGV